MQVIGCVPFVEYLYLSDIVIVGVYKVYSGIWRSESTLKVFFYTEGKKIMNLEMQMVADF